MGVDQGKSGGGSFEAGATLYRKQRREKRGRGLGGHTGSSWLHREAGRMTGTDGEAGRARG